MSVNVHYCQGHISGISLIPKSEKKCHEVSSVPAKKTCCKASLSYDDKSCCSDKTSIVSLDFDSPGISNAVSVDLDFAKAQSIVHNFMEVHLSSVITATGLDPPEAILLSGSDLRISLSSFLC